MICDICIDCIARLEGICEGAETEEQLEKIYEEKLKKHLDDKK